MAVRAFVMPSKNAEEQREIVALAEDVEKLLLGGGGGGGPRSSADRYKSPRSIPNPQNKLRVAAAFLASSLMTPLRWLLGGGGGPRSSKASAVQYKGVSPQNKLTVAMALRRKGIVLRDTEGG